MTTQTYHKVFATQLKYSLENIVNMVASIQAAMSNNVFIWKVYTEMKIGLTSIDVIEESFISIGITGLHEQKKFQRPICGKFFNFFYSHATRFGIFLMTFLMLFPFLHFYRSFS